MKTVLAKWFGANWETTVIGWIVTICGATSVGGLLYGMLTEREVMFIMGACGMLKGLGFIRSKDGNVSNAEKPTTAATVIQTSTGTVVRNAVVPCVALLLLVGCSAAQVQQNQAVLVQLRTFNHNVVVSGCAGLPTAEVLAGVVVPLIPQLAASGPAIAVGEDVANKLCAVVAAQVAAQKAGAVAPAVPVVK